MRREVSDRICAEAAGKTIARMFYEDEPAILNRGYWVIEFTDGTEMCVNLLADVPAATNDVEAHRE